MVKVLALSDNYRSIKADLYNREETNERPCRSKRLAFSLQSNLGYEYETDMFSSMPIHSISLNYDLDLPASIMILAYNRCLAILKSHHARQSYELDVTGFYCSL